MKTLILVALASAPISVFAQSYGALGNDPVRSHTYLGDRPIKARDGGTLCRKSRSGFTCGQVRAYKYAR